MASITVRDLPDKTKQELRIKAAKSGMSLEAYIRTILQKISASDDILQPKILDLANQYFGTKHGEELKLPSRASKRQEVMFDE